MRKGRLNSSLLPRHIFRYGQEYLDNRWKRLRGSIKSSALACPRCGATYHDGRWAWKEKSLFSKKTACPACRQISESRPSGILILSGERYRAHILDITALIKHYENVEMHEHPMSRIMDISTQGTRITVRTTTAKIAETMGRMVQRSFGAISKSRNVDDRGAITIELIG